MRFWLSIFLWLLACVNIVAQSNRSEPANLLLRNADKEYDSYRFAYAIPFYNAYLKNEPEDVISISRLAFCYKKLHQYDSAYVYYKKAVSINPRNTNLLISFSEVAAYLGLYDEAIDCLNKLKQADQISFQPEFKRFINNRIEGYLNHTVFKKDTFDYKIKYLTINSDQEDYSAQPYKQGFLFISNRYQKGIETHENGWDALPYSRVYYYKDLEKIEEKEIEVPKYTRKPKTAVVRPNSDFTASTSNDNDIIKITSTKTTSIGFANHYTVFNEPFQSLMNIGPIAITKDGTTFFFTRNSKKKVNGIHHLEIAMVVFKKGKWSEYGTLDFINPAFDYMHPAISDDGTELFFSSNMPGSYGGADLYKIKIENGQTGKYPENLGPAVNTHGNEVFPTVNNGTLFFSSNGHPGLGGIDIYKIPIDKISDVHAIPENIGYPINSNADDFGYVEIAESDKSIFSSNRLGSDDLFSSIKQRNFIKINSTILDDKEKRRVADIRVQLFLIENNASRKLVNEMTTNHTGNFEFFIRPGYRYVLQGEKSNQEVFSKELMISNRADVELEPFVIRVIQQHR